MDKITVKNIELVKKLTYPNNEPEKQMPYFSASCYSSKLGLITMTAQSEQEAIQRLFETVNSLTDWEQLKNHNWPIRFDTVKAVKLECIRLGFKSAGQIGFLSWYCEHVEDYTKTARFGVEEILQEQIFNNNKGVTHE